MKKKSKEPNPTKELSGIPVYCAFTEAMDIADVKPNPRNPNKHPDNQIALLAKIIRAQGWRSPIVVSNLSGLVVKGHGRLQAAQLLQVQQVPVDRQDYATQAEEHADMVADNRLSELADVDKASLDALLTELKTEIDIELAGFTSVDLDLLSGELGGSGSIPESNKPIDENELAKTEHECPKCGFAW